MSKIAIRADGGSKIGMGHIMRTLVLAKELAKTNDVFYVCRVDKPLSDKYSYGIEKIKNKGFKVVTIAENHLIDELKNIDADCLITDSYDVEENYFNETKKIFKKTGYIDDMNLYYFNVDFIINQNVNAKELTYRTSSPKLFLGSKYCMLREEFRKLNKKEIKNNIRDVLITVGGANINNVTEKILNVIIKTNFMYYYHVVIGPSFGDRLEIENISKDSKNIKLYYTPPMADLMSKCDIAISGCGSTLYELAAIGVPTIGIVLADNQRMIANYLGKHNCIKKIDNINEIEKELKFLLESMTFNNRKAISTNQKKLINVDGVRTLSNGINEVLK